MAVRIPLNLTEMLPSAPAVIIVYFGLVMSAHQSKKMSQGSQVSGMRSGLFPDNFGTSLDFIYRTLNIMIEQIELLLSFHCSDCWRARQGRIGSVD